MDDRDHKRVLIFVFVFLFLFSMRHIAGIGNEMIRFFLAHCIFITFAWRG